MEQLRVVDISAYAKGFIDWQRLKANFVHCILRAGVGINQDVYLERFVDQCNEEEISYSTYHIPDPLQGASIHEQAALYFTWYGVQGHKLWFDYEPNTGSRFLRREEAETYLRTLKSLGADVGIYGGSYGLRDQLGNPDWLMEYDLWISQYPFMPGTEEKYRHYDLFVEDYAGQLPWHPVEWDMPWKEKIVLWQFTDKLSARDYFATAPFGLHSGDGNITTVEPEIWWACVASQEGGGQGGEADEPVDVIEDSRELYAGLKNQDIINLFFEAAEPFTADPWNAWIVRAGLGYMASSQEKRQELYDGPLFSELPGLSEAEKAALLAVLIA